MNEHLLSPMWMDAANYPEITFETTAIKNVQTKGDSSTADVTGKF